MPEFKHYKSHKEVYATPLTRGDYNTYRGWQIPADENPDDEGYLVQYGVGTEDFYESWSPKKQFDEGYTEILPPRVQRMMTEQTALKQKLDCLQEFISEGTVFDTLDCAEQALLLRQAVSMNTYHETLSARIASALS